LAQGLSLSVRGIGFPGHFLVRANLSVGQVVIDPLTGRSVGREELLEWLEPYRRRHGIEDDVEAPLGLYLQTATPRDIIARMLRNLKEIYKSQEDWERLLAVQERLIVLLPSAWSEYRDRGLAHAEMGRRERALQDLECYVQHADETVDMEEITEQIEYLRRQQRS